MTNQEIREALKVDLGITAASYDSRLDAYVTSAQRDITAAGATINLEKIEHCQLIIMYAAWQWRRRDTGAPMPSMVRRALNNLVFGQRMAKTEESGGKSE